MLKEVQRQEKDDNFQISEKEKGEELFYFFGTEISQVIGTNDWVYEATETFASEYAREYFTTLRLLRSLEETQNNLVALKFDISRLLELASTLGLAPQGLKLKKLSDFTQVVQIEKLPLQSKQEANKLLEETTDLELHYINVLSQASKSLYEKGIPRVFYVVKRALKVQMGLSEKKSDSKLMDAHQCLNWCDQHLPSEHILSQTLVKYREFYKIVRNVDSHVTGPKWLPNENAVLLPDQSKQIIVDIDDFLARYRYLWYFCEMGARLILGVFCDRERGEISNKVTNQYMKMYDNPELQSRLCDYPL